MKSVLTSFALLAAGFTPSAYAIDCGKARTPVEIAICTNEELLDLDASLNQRYYEMGRFCRGEQGKLLKATQQFWLRERNACSNADGDAVAQCAADRMAQRIGQFDRMGRNCDIKAVAGQLRYVDPWFVALYSTEYAESAVHVYGGMKLDICARQNEPVKTVIGIVTGRTADEGTLRVIFKSMPPRERELLCNKKPSAHWRGMVRTDSQGIYLYLTDVLGNDLP